MSGYLVESDWIIDAIHERADATQMLASLSSDGIAISTVTYLDLVIAATALTHDLTLPTRNLRDFQLIPNLRLYRSP